MGFPRGGAIPPSDGSRPCGGKPSTTGPNSVDRCKATGLEDEKVQSALALVNNAVVSRIHKKHFFSSQPLTTFHPAPPLVRVLKTSPMPASYIQAPHPDRIKKSNEPAPNPFPPSNPNKLNLLTSHHLRSKLPKRTQNEPTGQPRARCHSGLAALYHRPTSPRPQAPPLSSKSRSGIGGALPLLQFPCGPSPDGIF